MAKNFKILREKMSPEARARAEDKAAKFAREMTLEQLRTARQLTQVDLAKKLRKGQPAISKMENSADMYVSSLKKAITAMGGVLEIRAIFPLGDVRIIQFSKPGRKRKVAARK